MFRLGHTGADAAISANLKTRDFKAGMEEGSYFGLLQGRAPCLIGPTATQAQQHLPRPDGHGLVPLARISAYRAVGMRDKGRCDRDIEWRS